MRSLALLLLVAATGCMGSLRALGPLPVPRADAADLEWVAVPGQLFVEGISVDDVRQGALDDCFFVASVAALAWAQPERLSEAIVPRPDGAYDVTLFSRGQRVTVTVDAVLPMHRGAPAYLAPGQPGELWGMLFEKAYARWRGSYRVLEGGQPGRVLRVVSGLETETWAADADARRLFSRLSNALAARSAIVAATKGQGLTLGLVPNHAYTVLATGVHLGEPVVVLRNPWGGREPLVGESAGGRLTLSLEGFRRSFRSLTVLPLEGADVGVWQAARGVWDDATEEWEATAATLRDGVEGLGPR